MTARPDDHPASLLVRHLIPSDQGDGGLVRGRGIPEHPCQTPSITARWPMSAQVRTASRGGTGASCRQKRQTDVLWCFVL